MTDLSAQQEAGIEKINQWYQTGTQRWAGSGDVFRLFGYAGTGKTTMAKEIPLRLGLRNVVYGTYTGKAAHVLRTKGAGPVSTIHSAIYMPTTSAEAKARLLAAQEELNDALEAGDGAKVAELQAQLPGLEADARRLAWELNPMAEWSTADLIILDEVSMVNARLAEDIESFGVPILVLGDPAQLPPVEGGGHYTKTQPDHLLTEIHRQALENPITALANRIRESRDITLGLRNDDFRVANVREAMEFDQVLCGTNKRRWAMIEVMRQLWDRPKGVPVAGDRIMCLTNNKDLAVFNGQQFDVLAVTDGTLGPTLTVKTDEGSERSIAAYADGFLGREMQDQAKNSGAGLRGQRMLATFAQAITVHKAQGSEWRRVYVVNEAPMMISMGNRKAAGAGVVQARQWMYTAATRAQEELTITAPRA